MCVFAAGYAPAVGVQQQQQQSSHTQAQAVLGTYSPMASHQRSMVQVNTEHPKILFCVRLETTQPLREAFNSLESACGGKFYPLTNFTSLFFSLSLCREVFQCPIPKVKLWPRLVGRQVTAAWCPHPPITAAAILPAATTSAPRPGAHSTDDASTDGAMILEFLRETHMHTRTHFLHTVFHTPSPPYTYTRLLPDGAHKGTLFTLITSMFTHTHTHSPLTYRNIWLYQSLIVVYIRAAVLNA